MAGELVTTWSPDKEPVMSYNVPDNVQAKPHSIQQLTNGLIIGKETEAHTAPADGVGTFGHFNHFRGLTSHFLPDSYGEQGASPASPSAAWPWTWAYWCVLGSSGSLCVGSDSPTQSCNPYVTHCAAQSFHTLLSSPQYTFL